MQSGPSDLIHDSRPFIAAGNMRGEWQGEEGKRGCGSLSRFNRVRHR
jgi:hypothetical protein